MYQEDMRKHKLTPRTKALKSNGSSSAFSYRLVRPRTALMIFPTISIGNNTNPDNTVVQGSLPVQATWMPSLLFHKTTPIKDALAVPKVVLAVKV